MPSKIHDLILKKVIQRADEVLFADFNGYNKNPPEINGKTPDAIVKIDGEEIIVEVETCESISLQETKEQYSAFSSDERKFRVYTPRECSAQALDQAKEWEFIKINFFYFKDV